MKAAVALWSTVERAAVHYRLRWSPPPVAGPEQIDAQLDAFFDQLLVLTAPGRDGPGVDEGLADACARIEEWTA